MCATVKMVKIQSSDGGLEDSVIVRKSSKSAENSSKGMLDGDDYDVIVAQQSVIEDNGCNVPNANSEKEVKISNACKKLKHARNYYLSSDRFNGHSLSDDTVDMLWRDFTGYRDSKDYVVLKQHGGNGDGTIFGMKLPKRGNDKYQKEKRQKINGLLGGLDEESVELDFSDREYTNALMVTFTYDTKVANLRWAWENIGIQFNQSITSLRQRYGKISTFRVFESYENGYPHIHALLLFHEHEFDTFEHSDGSMRIENKNELENYCNWHSHIDVKGVKNVAKSINYLAKYFTKDTIDMAETDKERRKAKLTLALSWIFRKRSFAVSGDFREVLHDSIHDKSNSNTFGELYYMFRWLEGIDFEFLGTADAEFLGIDRNENYIELDEDIEDRIEG